ncbi:hypothetical protein E4U44_002961 [Claviceps purpurea]|nr:hypothetical protein E4U26_002552 [Claviceps purpurea]KAG6312945.1 hypothetical protein E4U44_002961 [Claviceps purpurea]
MHSHSTPPTHGTGPKRWLSSLSFASVPFWRSRKSEPPSIVSTRNALQKCQTLSSSTDASIAVRSQDSSCSGSGAKESASDVHSPQDARSTAQLSSTVSSRGTSEAGRQPEVSTSGPSLNEAGDSAGTPCSAQRETESSGNLHWMEDGAEEADSSVVEPLSPQPPDQHQSMSRAKRNSRAAEFMTSDIPIPKRKRLSFWVQLRRGTEPVSGCGSNVVSSSPPLSPGQPAERRQPRSLTESGSSYYSVQASKSTACASDKSPFDITGSLSSLVTGLRAGLHDIASALSVTEKEDEYKPTLRREGLLYTIAVVIPDGKFFEDDAAMVHLLSA